MKKVLATLFFLGIATTGFSQTYTISGKATVFEASETKIDVFCGGTGTCVKLTPISGGGATRVEIPSIKFDKVIIAASSVNGTPLESLPTEIPGNDQLFSIEFREQKKSNDLD